MKSLLYGKIGTALFLLLCVTTVTQAQQWKPSMKGIHSAQSGTVGDFHIQFKNEILGRDWIYGNYLDEDSLNRCLAYRVRGKWIPIPFSIGLGSGASDIVMYGDTLYIIGSFGNIVLDSNSSSLPNTDLIKWFNDSLWVQDLTIAAGANTVMSVKGDSLLIWGSSYFNPPDIIYTHFMTSDGGKNWQYPYSITHPDKNSPDFGASQRLEILQNGDIVTLNNGSSGNSGFKGVVRWDGNQWRTYGSPTFGSTSRVFDFEFYKGQLYMGGTFNQNDFPTDPGNFIAQWNGTNWNSVATGTDAFVSDLFVHDSILYCRKNGGSQFGDAQISFFAGWNGTQWCGTDFNYSPAPVSFGFVNDTLFATFYFPGNINGDTISYMNYYDGDFLHGPNAVCSTPGLGQNEQAILSFNIYPNPTTDYLTIQAENEGIEKMQIFDMQGRTVKLLYHQNGSSSSFLDITGFGNGLYTLIINDTYYHTFLKE